LVVSWKDAAEIQLGTPNDALVIPSNTGVASSRFRIAYFNELFICTTKDRILFS
jgi:hypothetical protein